MCVKKSLFLLLFVAPFSLAQDFDSSSGVDLDVVGDEGQPSSLKPIDRGPDEIRSANIQQTQMLQSVYSRAEALEALVDKYPSLKLILSDNDPEERKLKEVLGDLYDKKIEDQKNAAKALEDKEAKLTQSSLAQQSFGAPPSRFPQNPPPFSTPRNAAPFSAPQGAPVSNSQANDLAAPVVKPEPPKKKIKPITRDLVVYATMGTLGPDGRAVTPMRAIVDAGGALTKSLKVGDSFQYSGQTFVLRGVSKKDSNNLMVTFTSGGRLVNFVYPLVQRGG